MTDQTLEEVAAELGVSGKTLRRILPRIPDLRCNRIGRKITFSPADVATIREAVRGPYATSADPGRSATRIVTFGKRASSPSSAQERVRELTRRQLGARS